MEDCPTYTDHVRDTVERMKGRIPDKEWGYIACAVGITSEGVGHWPNPEYETGPCRNCGMEWEPVQPRETWIIAPPR